MLIGIIFRQMSGKPSILAEYEQPSARRLIPDPPSRPTVPYASPKDIVFMEDDHARCTLDVSALEEAQLALFVTGVVLAVRGQEHRPTGAFAVTAVSPAMPAPQPRLPALGSASSPSRYVCLVSALDVASLSPSHELFIECLRGTFDISMPDDEVGATSSAFASTVVHTIVAGNIHASPPPGTQPHAAVSTGEKSRFLAALQEADRFMSALAAILPTSVMPGSNDATNLLLPQQPLHRCLLPAASRNANLSRVCNPFCCAIDSRVFLGTSGQNIDDLSLYGNYTPSAVKTEAVEVNEAGDNKKDVYRASGDKVLDILSMIINSRHLAPTCPDTLGSYPFSNSDPFVLGETPHVLFAGNQKEFATRLMELPLNLSQDSDSAMETDNVMHQQVRLISVPRFDETGQAVFVDLDTLECTVREFSLTM